MNAYLHHYKCIINGSFKYHWSDLHSGPGIVLILFIVTILTVSCNGYHEFVTKAQELIPQKTYNFNTDEVKLLDGPFKESQDAEAKYILSLDLDRLLSPFIRESGIEPKAPAYPGWETRSLPGVALSFYLSGAARLYKLTADEKFLKNINYLLTELRKCQVKNDGYLLGSRGGKQIFKKLEDEGYYPGFSDWGNGHGEPYYVMEKLFSGLIDVYRICQNPQALKILIDLADWMEIHMSHISDPDLQKIMDEEYGGMNWVLSDVYVISGNKKYLAMSKRWQDDHVTIPLTEGMDILNGIHANTQFPKISGLAARYPFTADPSDLRGATLFWESVVKHRTYVTGGNSESEYFKSRDSLANTLTVFTSESCNEYNMLKLTSLLYKIEPKVEYADFMERVLYNHILSAQNTEDGKVCYHLPLMPGAERYFRSLYDEFSCCVCSGMDSYTRHSEYIYAHSETDLYVNLYIPSELNWKKKRITLKQETGFPFKDFTNLCFNCDRETEFGLNIRNPFWLSAPMTIKVNGEVQILNSLSGYYTLTRKWQKGDIVEIRLPMNIRYESMPDDKNKIAFFYGPVLLAGALERDYATALVKENIAPALIADEIPFNQWLKPEEGPLEYTTTISKPVEVHLKPLFKLIKGPYTVYWQIVTEKEFMDRIALKKKRTVYNLKLNHLTLDKVIVGNEDSEKKHELTGTSNTGKGNYGILMDETWRSADPVFSYKMKVQGNEPVSLLCNFMGRYQHENWDCRIKIDSTVIAYLKRGKDDSYPVISFYYCFPVPLGLTKGKEAVQVKFETRGSGLMPKLIELRTIKNQDYQIYPTLLFL